MALLPMSFSSIDEDHNFADFDAPHHGQSLRIPKSECSEQPLLVSKPQQPSPTSRARPLRLINTHTLKLVDFSDNDPTILPYAILSHRWLPGEEVSFEEYVELRDEVRGKSGYRKILQACEKARRDDLGYIWIDTCCIDQSNHDEVARAVMTMYAYYENSDVCYAYLADVLWPGPAHMGRKSHWKKSQWFKRGWTLQELVAPRRVVFFTSHWIPFGDKQSLKVDINRLTGIPCSVLEYQKPITEVDIRERMSWCAGRRTSKPADLAYCLLGLLGVTMEPDYTEDITSAFRRLQSTLAETYPETFQTFEDADNIYQILMCSNVRTRLGISDATYKAKSSVILLHQEDNFSPAQHVDSRLKSVTSTLTTCISTTLRKRVLNPMFPPIFGRMASHLQALFGGSSHSSGASKSRSHSRSDLNTNVPYMYSQYPASIVPMCFPTRSHSPIISRIKRPSPLRYNAYVSSTVASKTRPTRCEAGDSFFPYPLYTPAAAKHSSHRESSMTTPTLSIQSYTSFARFASRATCSTSAASRQALKQTHTWHSYGKVDGLRPQVSFINPNRPQTFRMHPLLATSSRICAPISYDVMYRPSPQTVLDRITRTAVPSHTLGQPATDPPTYSTLVLRSDMFPWPITVRPAAASATGLSSTKFYLGESSRSVPVTNNVPITNNVLILTLYSALSSRVTQEEWDALGKGSRAQRKIARAYERRTRALGDKEGGVRRIDWLGKKTRLIGIEVDRTVNDTGVAKLIFGKP